MEQAGQVARTFGIPRPGIMDLKTHRFSDIGLARVRTKVPEYPAFTAGFQIISYPFAHSKSST